MQYSQINETVFQTLLTEVKKVVAGSSKLPVIIAIDGNCGSGKTLYASQLATYLQASLIHCDDFFLPKEMRTAQRLNQVGGNIHYERLHDTLCALTSGGPFADKKQSFTYMAYNCSTNSYEQVTQALSNIVIVEGSYALHPILREFYDLKILLKADAQTQYNRLLKREGEQGVVNFVNKWIPLENRYFETLDISDCTLVDTSEI